MKQLDVQLFTACESGSLDNVKRSILQGADVNARNHHQFIPLHIAARAGYTEIVDHLLDCGALIEAKNQNDNTCLHSAAYGNQPETIIKLIERKANLCAINKDGDTPLHSAAWKGNTEAVLILIQYKADLNRGNKDGDTPLHLATWNNHSRTMSALIQKRADMRAVSNNNETPLHLAVAKGHLEALGVLLANSANVEVQNKKGETIFDMREWSECILPKVNNLIRDFSVIFLRELSNPRTSFELDVFYFLNEKFFSFFSRIEIIAQSNLIKNADEDIKAIFKSSNRATERMLRDLIFILPSFQREVGLSEGYQKKCSIILSASGFFKSATECSSTSTHSIRSTIEESSFENSM